ncbi:MAG: hypothetical protein NTU41_01470, partial [Chloroflexi bacterium]|nr:hypothetical protein [Chloroflexota bacterium]
MRFSERHGLKPVRQALQFESMDQGLRNSLWNVLFAYPFASLPEACNFFKMAEPIQNLFLSLHVEYFASALDEITQLNSTQLLQRLRGYFFSCKWYEVYD